MVWAVDGQDTKRKASFTSKKYGLLDHQKEGSLNDLTIRGRTIYTIGPSQGAQS